MSEYEYFVSVDDFVENEDPISMTCSVSRDKLYIEFTEGYITVATVRQLIAWLQSALPPSDAPC
jgi:hypothetical protein